MEYHTTTPTAMSMQFRKVPEWIVATATEHPFQTLGSVAGIFGILALLQYRGAIKKRLKMVKEESWIFGAGVTMERIPTAEIQKGDRDDSSSESMFQNLQLLELNPDFRKQYPDWSLLTLGDYMSSLRPKQLPKTDNIPAIVKREIEAGLAAALLKALGPQFGSRLAPRSRNRRYPVQSAGTRLVDCHQLVLESQRRNHVRITR